MRIRNALLLVTIALAIVAAVAMAETQAYVQESGNGKIDWIRGRLFVVGEGVPKAGVPSPGQKRLTAKRAAQDDALRNVATVIAGVAVSNETETVDSALNKDVIKTKVQAFIKGGKCYDSSSQPLMQALGYTDLGWNPDEEVYKIVMEIPMAGAQSMASAIWQPILSAPAKPHDPPQYQDVPPPDSRNIPASSPTGLIVDCSSANIEPAMSPKIYNKNTRQEIYGGANVDTETAVRRGIAGYVTSLEDARKAADRVGNNPLIVPAAAAVGKRAVAVSADDAQRIQDADRQGSFLKQCNVMFVLKAQ